MIIDKVYLVGVHRYSNKAGIPAEIIGVKMIKPSEDLEPRLCYHIQWSDLCEDWVAVDDAEHFEIITFTDIVNGNIPKIIH